ncbi:MAG TPA: FHA domain-containing protein [Kofleriaceae bacterium]|nr:FHA domain-containing protein [Kofleriaceae bacterium]
MRLATCVIGVALCGLLARSAPVRADDAAGAPAYRAVIDSVEVEPASIGGLRLRVTLSALALQGQLLDLSDAKAIRLLINGGKVDAPYALGSYAQTGADTAIAVVVEANQAFAETLPSVITAFDEGVLGALPADHTQLVVLPYNDNTGTGKLAPLKTAHGKLTAVTADANSNADPALLDTIERAMLLLKKAKPPVPGRPLRKLIIVIGDGRDRASDRDRVTNLGKRAAKEGVRIHTFGYAPSKVLRPLLTLGELSKRSLGTFRWVRAGGSESWTPAFAQLRDEINKQYVLTYFVPGDQSLTGKLKIATSGRAEATSNELAIPEPGCGGQACAGYCVAATCVIPRAASGRGVVGWIFLIVGSAVGVIVVLGVIGYLMQRRQSVPMPMPGQFPPGMHFPPGMQAPPAGAFAYPNPPGQPAMMPRAAPAPAKRGWFQRGPKTPPPMPAVAPPTGPALIVLSGPRTGQRVTLVNGFTIGKAPTSSLVIDDGYASTHHAQLGVDVTGVCRLYDLNSTNGTHVNGARITEIVLDHGMMIQIGSTQLQYLAQ